MRLKKLVLKNFRGYKNRTIITFDDITAFVGRNDSGKSTLLEALDIFFNDGKGTVKIDDGDVNVESRQKGDVDIEIGACFSDLPDKLILDATNETSLGNEYLLNEDGELEIIKQYHNAGKAKVYIFAVHPSNPECSDLLQKSNRDLKKRLDELQLTDEHIDKTKNASIRAGIWNHYKDDLQLKNRLIDVTKGEIKTIFNKLEYYLPVYSLFQSDRKNSDADSEVQDPLKHAVKEILVSEDLQSELDNIAEVVTQKLKDVAKHTVDKLKEMDPEIAKTLEPMVPDPKDLKWADVFKNVSISGDQNIPINKRGSGVRRLILLNFFRAEAERLLSEREKNNDSASIIYAIEEPETSQHYKNQIVLINALQSLADNPKVQVILTTHSGIIVKNMKFANLRLVDNGKVQQITHNCLPYPSLNEVNYIAFDEATEEYHDELYGVLTENDLLKDFEKTQDKVPYKHIFPSGKIKNEQLTLTRYIRHQIHHPENKENPHYDLKQLRKSIEVMRKFLFDVDRL